MALKAIFDCFEAVGATSSTTEKKDLLANLCYQQHVPTEHKQTVGEILDYTYNPYHNFYITLPTSKVVNGNGTATIDMWHGFRTLLDQLRTRALRGSDARAAAEKFVAQSGEAGKWFGRILNRDLEIGIAESTILKILPGLFPSWKPQKGEPWTLDIDHVVEPMICQPKYDGYRCIALKRNGVVSLMSFNGKPLYNYDHITDALAASSLDNFLIEGEIWSPLGFWVMQKSAKALDPKKIEAIKDLIATTRLSCFDTQSLTHWENKKCVMPEIDRYNLTAQRVEQIGSDAVQLTPMCWVTNDDELMAAIAEWVTKEREYNGESYHFEGVMLKYPKSEYAYRRAQNWFKVKEEFEGDFTITGAYEGDEPATIGTLGGINIQGDLTFKGKDYHIECNCGSGFKTTSRNIITRNELWKMHQAGTLAGQMCEVKFWDVTKSEDNPHYALRFPVFQRIRDKIDK